VRFFLLTLGALLVGYAFLGRGFAHLGVPPLYLGEFVLGLGLAATVVAAVRTRLQTSRSRLVALLLVFMLMGLIHTVPYIPTYGADALRDATVWGYAVFALMLFVLLDRDWVLRLFRLYGYAAVAFLFWGPVAYYIFAYYQSGIPVAPGSTIQILFFKNQDMAVQTAGAIAFLVVGTPLVSRVRDFAWRFAAALPASWMIYTTGTLTRGGLAAVVASVGVLGAVAGRTRNWLPLVAGGILFTALVAGNISLASFGPGPTPRSTPISTPLSTPSSTPISTPSSGDSGPAPTTHATAAPVEQPSPVPESETGRSVTTTQWWENILSIFGNSSDTNLQGTKQFRLDWWNKIIGYTFNGPYFWTGKGFGINLADADGFQPTADHSLREPHNTHISLLAREGVPGFLLWILLQGAFALLLLRALLAHRRAGDMQLAAVAAWILAFWAAMMVNTSFDPYLEGPQGGIWFWVLFGLGLVIIRLVPRRQAE